MERIKEAFIKYRSKIVGHLLKRYVGFLLDIDYDESRFNLNGGSLKNVNVNILAANEEAEKFNLPFVLMNGFMGEISVNVPWANGLDDIFVEVTDLRLIVRPKPRSGDVLVGSMFDSMSTSVQIAQECLSQVNEDEYIKNLSSNIKNKSKRSEKNSTEMEAEEIDAVQNFAQFIDTVLSKIIVRFNNILLRIEYLPKCSTSGIALHIEIGRIDFFDESGLKENSQPTQSSDPDKSKVSAASLSSKKFIIEGVSIYTEEFPSEKYFSEDDLSKLYTLKKTLDEVPLNASNLNMNDTLPKNYDLSKSPSNTNTSCILLAKLLYKQEIKLMFRKAETKGVSVPKVNIESNFGCWVFFMSPRQIHLLLELMNGMVSPEKIGSIEMINKENFEKQKPMNQSDFRTVERDLMKCTPTPRTMVSHSLNNQEGWSSPPDVALDDEYFYPVNPTCGDHPLTSSILTDVSDFESSFMSTASNIFNNICTKKDDTLTMFNIKIQSIYMVLLHEDIMIPSDDMISSDNMIPSDEMRNIITDSSLAEMKKKVKTFFSHMNCHSNCESSYDEFNNLNEIANFACLDNHLRMVSTGLLIEGKEKIFSNKWEHNLDISASWLEIKECLNESNSNSESNDSSKMFYSDLLSFTKYDSSNNLNQFHLPMKPKLQININQSVTGSGRPGRINSPKLSVTIMLEQCLTEVDISIIDRINVLLNIQDVTRKKQNDSPTFKLGNQAQFQELMEEVNSKPETITIISLNCNLLTVKLFFPIPDLRPVSNMNRIPWWKKNVRKEVFIINAVDILIKSNILNEQPNFEILSSEIEFLLQEAKEKNEEDKDKKILPTPIMRVSSPKYVEKGFNPIRICVKSFPAKIHADLNDIPVKEQEDISKSTMDFFAEVNRGSANLFNIRKVALKNQGNNTEIPIPSNGKEIHTYINETLKNVKHNVDISLTDVKLILPSKHLYEVLYNRLVTDLLLWTPSAPKCSNKILSSLNTIIDDQSIETTLRPCPSNHSGFKAFTSLNDYLSGEYENDNDDQNYNNDEIHQQIGQTDIGLMVKIRNGAGSIHTPFKDEDGDLIPSKYGNVSFLFEKGLIFIASGYQGDINAVQGCITLNTVNVYHQPDNIVSHSPTLLNSDFLSSIKNMNSVLQRADALYKIGGGNPPVLNLKDCATLCFKSSFDEKRNENLFEVAGNLYDLTLRYFTTNSSESWVSQIQDMFNVEDYPIEGYTLPEKITEMNFNFEFCGLDYRPLNLPLKSYIAVDSLAISSNLAVKGNTSIIMFIIEDAGLFLSKNLSCNKVNLKNDYVCVLDIGVFELCMKFDNSSTSERPIKEINVSNNVIHIRTCSDSCKALMELLIYFSNCGDLVQEPSSVDIQHEPHNVTIEPSHTEEMVSSQYNQNFLNRHDIVANRMQEAMNETSVVNMKSSNDSVINKNGVEVQEFYFPDESKKQIRPASLEDPAHVKMINDLEEAQIENPNDNSHAESNENDDEEYCILDDIPGTGIKSPTGKPKAKYIISPPVCIKEGYFDLTANNPYLNKKKFSIPPNCKYNLQEMTVKWYMYGGRDFSSGYSNNNNDDDERNGNRNRSRKISTASISPHSSPELGNRQHREFGVTFSNGDTSIVSGRNSPLSLHASPTTLLKPNANMKWFSVGGPERCHDTLMEINLNKIKFKYQMYPEKAPFISQTFFAINDIMVRDCLAASKMNKFLYQPSNESLPKQTSSNMIQIKAVTRKSDPSIKYESNLAISCQPIKLNIDQDTLMFLYDFIESILKVDRESEVGQEERPETKFSHQPVLSLTSEYKSNSTYKSFSNHKTSEESFCNASIYFRSVEFSPEVPITIDYRGKHIDINSQFGAVGGLIIGLGELTHSELKLKKLHIKTGISGVNKLINCIIKEWTNDIKQTQVSSLLGGVGPMHSVVTLITGIKDLIWLPIEQYNTDGRVIRGLQRGTSAFTSSSAYALLDLTSRFVGTIQLTAETMYDMVSPGPSVKHKAYKSRKGQPKDIREGVSSAYNLVYNGLGDTASTLIKVATEEHSHKGVSGAVGGLLRQIPPSVVQPIIIATEATCTIIGGMTNQLVPDAGKEAAEKWKS